MAENQQRNAPQNEHQTSARFEVVLSRQNMPPTSRLLPPIHIQSILPNMKVPTVLHCDGKLWEVTYPGDRMCKAFNPKGWKNFVIENELKEGDTCIFELLDSSNYEIFFDVDIVRLTSNLFQPPVDGSTREAPIIID